MGHDVGRSTDNTADPERDSHDVQSTRQHGDRPDADHSAAAGTDSARQQFEDEPIENGLNAESLRSLMCDAMGQQVIGQDQEKVHDKEFFEENICFSLNWSNWVSEEMWTYWRKKFPNYRLSNFEYHFSQSKTDVLEIYCSESSQLTHQCQALGMSAARFGLKQGGSVNLCRTCQIV